jgi:hypothetical protein
VTGESDELAIARADQCLYLPGGCLSGVHRVATLAVEGLLLTSYFGGDNMPSDFLQYST